MEIVIIIQAIHRIEDRYRLTEEGFDLRNMATRIIYQSIAHNIGVIVSLLCDIQDFMEIKLSLEIDRLMRLRTVVDIVIEREQGDVELTGTQV